jgi:pentatricopeptide repeat protein
MVDKGVRPDNKTYNTMFHGYSAQGQWIEVVRIFKQMTKGGVQPNIVTWNSFLVSLCKHGRNKEVREVFDSMSGIVGMSSLTLLCFVTEANLTCPMLIREFHNL